MQRKKCVSLALVFFHVNSLRGSYHSLSISSPPQPQACAFSTLPAISLQPSSGNRYSGNLNTADKQLKPWRFVRRIYGLTFYWIFKEYWNITFFNEYKKTSHSCQVAKSTSVFILLRSILLFIGGKFFHSFGLKPCKIVKSASKIIQKMQPSRQRNELIMTRKRITL